jgi:hypothetical protein
LKNGARQQAHTLQEDLLRLQESVESAAGEADRSCATPSRRSLLAPAPPPASASCWAAAYRAAPSRCCSEGARMAGAWLQQEFLEPADTQESES